MSRLVAMIMAFFSVGLVFFVTNLKADAEKDRKAFVKYFANKFSDTPQADFINGIYSIDAPSREQWEAIEEFPPYELDLEEGEALYETPFKNGKTYANCFGDKGRQHYPYFDEKMKQVITLELAINQCRKANKEKPLKYKKGAIAKIAAYMAYQARGEKIDVNIASEGARKAYEEGKRFYYSKRGQLNFSCATCHVYGSGQYVRADRLSPGIGHTSHFPVYRSKWQALGTLHRRFAGCNQQVRAKAFKAQSKEYRNLEFFLAYMSNGLEINGPGARK